MMMIDDDDDDDDDDDQLSKVVPNSSTTQHLFNDATMVFAVRETIIAELQNCKSSRMVRALE